MITGWVLQRHKKTLSVVFGRLPFVFNVQAYLFPKLFSVVLLWDVDTSRGLVAGFNLYTKTLSNNGFKLFRDFQVERLFSDL